MVNPTFTIEFIVTFALEEAVIIIEKRVYNFCFQDSNFTPCETNLPSSNQPGRRRFNCVEE